MELPGNKLNRVMSKMDLIWFPSFKNKQLLFPKKTRTSFILDDVKLKQTCYSFSARVICYVFKIQDPNDSNKASKSAQDKS